MQTASTSVEISYREAQFGVVLSDFYAPATFDLGAGWECRLADDTELALILDEIRRLSSVGSMDGGAPSQEGTMKPGEANGILLQYSQDRKDWRYRVVRPSEAEHAPFQAVKHALRLCDERIWAEPWVIFNGGNEQFERGLARDRARCMRYFTDHSVWSRSLLPPSIEVNQLRDAVGLLSRFDSPSFPRLEYGIDRFLDLDLIPERSDMKTLGYFAILEGVLAHQSDPKDPVDGLTRQLIRNLCLLDNRAGGVLRLGDFGNADPEKAIKNLYAFRSRLAHGANPDASYKWFQENPHSEWAGPIEISVRRYLADLARRVLLAGIREPDLVRDLAR